ncbi:MAG: acyclic terpene utilization AtuA family protein [Rhodococcus sp. (in: high G+C Gram-positive bacteria)]
MIRVGNCSGFYGDRLSAMREMLDGGDLDVLTGDYLAELTMLILGRQRMKDPTRGYASTYLRQLEDCLGTALEKNVTLVSNAGGLAPERLAGEIRTLAERLGLTVSVAHVEGDDLHDRAEALGLGSALTANAYLGAFGISRCLDAGAQVVVTGRVTDASVVVAPAISRFGWGRDDLDALAGAVVAGHVIECGTQATGGNYSFFTEIADLRHPGFPIAEINSDGTSVITKHDGTGGAVTVGTVTAQLMYEITGHHYAGPDVTARMDTVQLTDDGPDRVRISGPQGGPVRGEAPPPTLKVSRNVLGGFRNEMTFVLTGLDIEAKEALVRRQMTAALTPRPRELDWTLARTDHLDSDTEESASALLRIVVRDSDPTKVGRVFSAAAVELALASYPGFSVTAPPSEASPYGVFDPAYVDQSVPRHTAVLADGTRVDIDPPTVTAQLPPDIAPQPEAAETAPDEPAVLAPLGRIAAARSGDKGGNANIGVWVRTDAEWAWLRRTLTTAAIKELLPETSDLVVHRYEFPHLLAVNFVIENILGEGVASGARFDPQAKGLGEWLRSRHVLIPTALLPATAPERLITTGGTA